MSNEKLDLDLYAILGLEPGADEKEVARAYKKKSLKHHPDRGGDADKFRELTHARDILLDPSEKKKYDEKLSQERLARKRQLERMNSLNEKRKKMRDDQIQRERGVDLKRQQATEAARRRQEIVNLRERTEARKRDLEESLSRLGRSNGASEPATDRSASQGSKSERTVRLKWDRRAVSHSDETIIDKLRQYGEIEGVKMKSSSAKVIFADKRAAAQAVRIEGHSSAWREVSLAGHIIDAERDVSTSYHPEESELSMLPLGPIPLEVHLDFEQRILQKLRERIAQHRASDTQVSSA